MVFAFFFLPPIERTLKYFYVERNRHDDFFSSTHTVDGETERAVNERKKNESSNGAVSPRRVVFADTQVPFYIYFSRRSCGQREPSRPNHDHNTVSVFHFPI